MCWLCDYCFSEHGGANTSLRYWFHFLQKRTSKRDCQAKYSFILKLLSSLHTVFHKGYTNLHSHQQSKKSPFSSRPCQQFIFCPFHKSHSYKSEVITHCGLISISLIISDVELLFMYALAIWLSSLGKKSTWVICPFLYWNIFFVYSWIVCLLCVLDINPPLDVWLEYIFSYSMGYLSVLSVISFALCRSFLV